MERTVPAYVGGVHPNCDYFHGQIPFAKGIHLYQVSRANRMCPKLDDGTGHTYKHAPDITWYHGRFYIQYLTNPEDEHGGAGVSVLASSADGSTWGNYQISFPEYWIPACEVTDAKGNHHIFDGTKPAFMHQRMGFYHAANDVMLVSGFYGWSPALWMTNWDNYGIGRVVRRLYPDGSLGDIYFITINWQGGWEKNMLQYELYEKSSDEEFVQACRELLASPLYVQQWAEENGDGDFNIRVKHPEHGTYQAFCFYHRSENEVVGLWKHSFVSRSFDKGESWEKPHKEPSLVMSGQKIWGCRTSDGKYALVYDPTLETQHRFPMCVVTSEDGLLFDGMLLVHGEVPPIRYKGFCKDLGPQYMRGISERKWQEKNADGNLYLTYSVNKEDIWFADAAVPICGVQMEDIYEHSFTEDVLREWNLYQPKWAKIVLGEDKSLFMECREPYDYARIDRVLPRAKRIRVQFEIMLDELAAGQSVQAELCNEKHQTAVRIIFRPEGRLNQRTVCELGLGRWTSKEKMKLCIEADCERFVYTVSINGKLVAQEHKKTEKKEENIGNRKTIKKERENAENIVLPMEFRFMAAVNEIASFTLRTGEPRYLAYLEENPDQKPEKPLTGCETPLEHPVRLKLYAFEAVSI